MRRQIVAEAARIMAQENVHDYYQAKQKAQRRLGIASGVASPSNEEVDVALREYMTLFSGDVQEQRVQALRRHAYKAMRFFADFNPYLVGAALADTALEHSVVTLHLFAEPAERVMMFLVDQDIRHDLIDKSYRFDSRSNDHQRFPAYRFSVDDQEFEVIVFPMQKQRHPPLDPVHNKAMKRLGLKQVEALLVEGG